MKNEPDRTFLISVHPRWASAFFLSHNPKVIELRKSSFGASLKTGDSIVIYATMPTAEIIGIVQFVKRELLPIEQLWEKSEQGKLAKVSRAQFDAYYANQESGIGVWVSAAELFPSQESPFQNSAEIWSALAATAANSAIERRSNFCTSYNRPLHFSCISKRYAVRDDFTV